MIRLENITKTYKSGETVTKAVDDVSLQVEKGSIYGVIGYSGAGKSTLVRMVNLLERPTDEKYLLTILSSLPYQLVSCRKRDSVLE